VQVPDELRYTADHEWARFEGGRIRVGITDYAQDALGDVVFVQLPELGDELAPGGVLGEVESTKSVSELYAPVGGTVVAVNSDLANSPEWLNTDPYGAGWVCEIQPSGEAGEAGADDLLDAAAYRELTAG
jgi:glycine cleavage system H protein